MAREVKGISMDEREKVGRPLRYAAMPLLRTGFDTPPRFTRRHWRTNGFITPSASRVAGGQSPQVSLRTEDFFTGQDQRRKGHLPTHHSPLPSFPFLSFFIFSYSFPSFPILPHTHHSHLIPYTLRAYAMCARQRAHVSPHTRNISATPHA